MQPQSLHHLHHIDLHQENLETPDHLTLHTAPTDPHQEIMETQSLHIIAHMEEVGMMIVEVILVILVVAVGQIVLTVIEAQATIVDTMITIVEDQHQCIQAVGMKMKGIQIGPHTLPQVPAVDIMTEDTLLDWITLLLHPILPSQKHTEVKED